MVLPSHEELRKEHTAGASYGYMAKKYGVSENVIKGRVRTASTRDRLNLKTPPRPDLFKVDIGKPMSLVGDYMIVGDVHVPTTDYTFCHLPALVAKKQLSDPQLIVAGDLSNMDVFSKYQAYTPQVSWKQEAEGIEQLFKEWLETFSKIKVFMGNHDRRATKYTQGAVTSTDLIEMIIKSLPDKDRVEVSNYGWCKVRSGNVDWRISHQEDYSKNQLNVAGELALKYQSNIVSFHQHHLALGYDKYKHYIAIDGGGLFDDKQMAYVQLDDSIKANMQKGFVMLRNGFPYIFGDEKLTDYSLWI